MSIFSTSVFKKRNSLLTVGLLGIAFLLAACGSSSDASSTTTSVTNRTSDSTVSGNSGSKSTASFSAYRSCLTSHGVSLPAGSFPAGRVAGGSGFARGSSGFRRVPGGSSGVSHTGHGFASNPKFKAAAAACAKLAPKRGSGFFGKRTAPV